MKNKKLISEEVSRIKEMMGLQEDANVIGQNILQGLGDALRKGIAKSMLDAALPDDLGLQTSDFSATQAPLGVKTSDDSFYKEVLKGVGAPITDENMKFMYAWKGKKQSFQYHTSKTKFNVLQLSEKIYFRMSIRCS
jgi:predicted HD phosphohydrolase